MEGRKGAGIAGLLHIRTETDWDIRKWLLQSTQRMQTKIIVAIRRTKRRERRGGGPRLGKQSQAGTLPTQITAMEGYGSPSSGACTDSGERSDSSGDLGGALGGEGTGPHTTATGVTTAIKIWGNQVEGGRTNARVGSTIGAVQKNPTNLGGRVKKFWKDHTKKNKKHLSVPRP